jgi:hypothetical protein
VGQVRPLWCSPGTADPRWWLVADGWRLRLQADADTEAAKGKLAKTFARIKRWEQAVNHAAVAH